MLIDINVLKNRREIKYYNLEILYLDNLGLKMLKFSSYTILISSRKANNKEVRVRP